MDAVQGALTVAVAEGPKLLASAVTAVIQAKTGVTPRNVSTILMNDAGLSERLAAMGFVYNAESQEISLPTE